MTAGTAAGLRTAAAAPAGPPPPSPRPTPWSRAAPALVAAVLAGAYVIAAPPSIDLAAHLFRARLFALEGFGTWNNFWYAGHATPGYSVLFPAVSSVLGPRLAAALAAVATAAVFEPLAVRHFGPRAWLGALAFGAATAIDLYTGRLALAFGALPALAAVAALDRGRTAWACALAALSALCSPVAALFAAIAAAGCALGELAAGGGPKRALAPTAVAAAALAPVTALALSFGDPGTEPFALSTLLPLVAIELGAFA
ncbi:MAG TPA: hypothetical protein VFN87_06235, partial [Solirubrobacteraceae bacterium]|nr:hypothetical protein [Solirubrobacteraceae bacterium]